MSQLVGVFMSLDLILDDYNIIFKQKVSATKGL